MEKTIFIGCYFTAINFAWGSKNGSRRKARFLEDIIFSIGYFTRFSIFLVFDAEKFLTVFPGFYTQAY